MWVNNGDLCNKGVLGYRHGRTCKRILPTLKLVSMETTSRFSALRLTAALALALAALLCALIALLAAPQSALAARDLGQLCSKYETGNDPAEIDPASAYGAYQMSPGHAYTFAKELRDKEIANSKDAELATFAGWGAALVKAYGQDGKETGSKFDVAWKKIAAENSTLFFNAQYRYCKKHYYDEAVKYIKIAIPGLDVSKYTSALKNAVFSTAIQHGPYGCVYYIMKPALEEVGGWQDGLAESVLIDLIYYERSRVDSKAPASTATQISSSDSTAKSYGIGGKYLVHFYSCSSAVQVSVYNRLHNNERKDAQALLVKKGVTCKHAKTTGGKVVYSSANDATHTEKTTKKVCATCKAVLCGAMTKKGVAHKWTYTGTKWKCACGHSGVVHSVRAYRAPSKLTVRASRSASAKKVATMVKGGIYKPSKVTLKGGCYWGKFNVGSKTGYVRMSELSSHGDGCASEHAYLDDKCVYCGASRAAAKGVKAGNHKTLEKTTLRKAAYGASGKAATIASGKSVKVKGTVVNAYGEAWAKVTYGSKSGYVKLSALVK